MSKESRQAVQHVVVLVLFEIVAVGGLHALGTRPSVQVDWANISRWLAATPADQIMISLVWLVALVLAWWTLGSTLLYLLTRVRGFRAGARIAERLAPSAIRRVIDRAVATTVVTSVLFGTAAPALASERPAPPITQQAPATLQQYEPEPAGSEEPESQEPPAGPGPGGRAPRPVEQPPREAERQPPNDDRPGDPESQGGVTPRPGPGEDAGAAAEMEAERAEQNESPARESETATQDEQAGSDAETEQPERERTTERNNDENNDGDQGSDGGSRRRSTPRAGRSYTVRAGDHLWKIAVAVVAADGDRAGDRSAIASYWAQLVRAATPRLQSGDPNLIYPGEELELPPLQEQTGDRR